MHMFRTSKSEWRSRGASGSGDGRRVTAVLVHLPALRLASTIHPHHRTRAALSTPEGGRSFLVGVGQAAGPTTTQPKMNAPTTVAAGAHANPAETACPARRHVLSILDFTPEDVLYLNARAITIERSPTEVVGLASTGVAPLSNTAGRLFRGYGLDAEMARVDPAAAASDEAAACLLSGEQPPPPPVLPAGLAEPRMLHPRDLLYQPTEISPPDGMLTGNSVPLMSKRRS